MAGHSCALVAYYFYCFFWINLEASSTATLSAEINTGRNASFCNKFSIPNDSFLNRNDTILHEFILVQPVSYRSTPLQKALTRQQKGAGTDSSHISGMQCLFSQESHQSRMGYHIRLSGSTDYNQNLDRRTILKSDICFDSDSLL